MNDRDREPLSPEALRAESAVRGLAAARPDASFRARLEQDFVTGRIGRPRALELARPWFARPLVRLAFAPVALAVLALVVVQANRAPAWNLVRAEGEGFATVDGHAVPLGHRDELARLLSSGARVRLTPGSSLELASAGTLAMELTAGADVTLPAAPGRWFARRVAAEVRSGEMRVTTGAAFHGARLAVTTPEAAVEVTGTTLAVICEPTGTCVCVHQGVVMVGARGGEMVMVPAGRRRYVFNDGRAPELAEIRPNEHVELGAFMTRSHAGALSEH